MAEPTNITNNIANSTIPYKAWDNTGIAIVLTITGKTFTNADLPHYFCKVGNTAAVNPMLWQSGNSLRFIKSGSFAQNVAILLYDDLTPAQTITVNSTTENATITGIPQSIYADTVLSLTATANTGYKFKTTPKVTFTDGNGTPQSIDFVLNAQSNGATLTLNLGNYNMQNVAVINITATAAKEITVTRNLTNCIVQSGLPSTVFDTDTLTIVLAANSGYMFSVTPKLYIEDNNTETIATLNFTIAQNELTATITVDLSQYTPDINGIELFATAVPTPTPPQTITVNTETSNAAITGIPQTVYADTVLNLTATANNGYEFETEPYLEFIDSGGNPIFLPFTLASDNLTATLTADLGNYQLTGVNTISITATAAAVVPYSDKYGTINVYKVTTDNLAAFAAQRFFKERYNGTDTSGYFESVDLGNFVHSVKRFYCNVGETTAETLKCGNYNTQIAVQTPLNDNINIDCGTVTIPHKNNDNVDYNAQITLFLPFIGNVNLSVDYIGKTINLVYICNLITGNTIAKLTCNGILIDTYECNLCNDLIYKTSQKIETVKTAGTIDFNLQILKGLQPFAVLKYYQSENKKIYNADCLRGVISGYIGYLEITEITNFNNSTITENEKRLLFDELQTGVIILQS